MAHEKRKDLIEGVGVVANSRNFWDSRKQNFVELYRNTIDRFIDETAAEVSPE